ncbi:putative lipo domain protein, partial [Chlamydia psittaci 03DC29]
KRRNPLDCNLKSFP